jgi:hypothetical protein
MDDTHRPHLFRFADFHRAYSPNAPTDLDSNCDPRSVFINWVPLIEGGHPGGR